MKNNFFLETNLDIYNSHKDFNNYTQLRGSITFLFPFEEM